MHRVRMLIHFGVVPYLVFDGDRLPSKAGTEKNRKDRRIESKSNGLQLLSIGKTAQAFQELQKAVDVTPEMSRQVIEALKHAGVQYVVAPYEADSQLAYLERKGIINGVLSEDSDLLVFGVRVLLTKLDQYGDCVMLRRDDFAACREINLTGWTISEFRSMAILSGCDYLEGIHNMGLKTAHRLLRKYKTIDRVVRAIQLQGKFRVPPGYLQDFIRAETTFLYQWVYCPLTCSLVNLTTPEKDNQLTGLTYIGEYVEPETAVAVAKGDLNPMTKQPIDVDPKWIKSATPINANRTATAKATPLHSTKPINTFFKANRVPLSELDPNSFTPSPSQQALLRQPVRPWSADAAPRRYIPPATSTAAEWQRGRRKTDRLERAAPVQEAKTMRRRSRAALAVAPCRPRTQPLLHVRRPAAKPLPRALLSRAKPQTQAPRHKPLVRRLHRRRHGSTPSHHSRTPARQKTQIQNRNLRRRRRRAQPRLAES